MPPSPHRGEEAAETQGKLCGTPAVGGRRNETGKWREECETSVKGGAVHDKYSQDI